MNFLSLDVGGTFIKHALIDENGKILKQDKVATPYGSQMDFVTTIKGIKGQYDEIIEGIALSLPGTINADTGFIFQGGSLSYNAKTNIKEILEETLHLPVAVENDARCAALAEMWQGNLQGINNAIVLTFGTGIGGTLIINKELYKGTHFFSGEVSAILTKDIRSHGISAAWGQQGSVPNLVKRICEAKHVELSDGPTVFSWIAKGDETATTIFQEYCYDIVVQLFNLQIIIDPQRICIGGGVSANPLFIQSIEKAMDAFFGKLPIAIPRAEIMPCKFHNDSNLIGALYHFKKQHKLLY